MNFAIVLFFLNFDNMFDYSKNIPGWDYVIWKLGLKIIGVCKDFDQGLVVRNMVFF